jgi:hypothetical protein
MILLVGRHGIPASERNIHQNHSTWQVAVCVLPVLHQLVFALHAQGPTRDAVVLCESQALRRVSRHSPVTTALAHSRCMAHWGSHSRSRAPMQTCAIRQHESAATRLAQPRKELICLFGAHDTVGGSRQANGVQPRTELQCNCACNVCAQVIQCMAHMQSVAHTVISA